MLQSSYKVGTRTCDLGHKFREVVREQALGISDGPNTNTFSLISLVAFLPVP